MMYNDTIFSEISGLLKKNRFEYIIQYKNSYEKLIDQFNDKLIFQDKNLFTVNQTEIDKWEKYKQLLISSADLKKISYGDSCYAEDIIFELSEEEDMKDIMSWLYKIVLENSSCADLVCNILHAISHLEYKKVYPFGPMLAIAMFSNDIMIVQEYALKAFINWNSKDTLKYKNLSPKSKILEQRWKRAIDYINKFGEENEETNENDRSPQFMGA